MINNAKENIFLSYLAGIVDGEGCVTILRSFKRNSYSVLLTVTNTSGELMDWLLKYFGGHISERSKKRRREKRTYDWHIQGRNACNVLRQIQKYLIIKKEQANICIEYVKFMSKWHFGGKGNKRPLSVLKYQFKSWKRIQDLNS